MADEPFVQFFKYLMDKMFSKGTFVNNPDNMVIGESIDLIGKDDSYFPRMEYLIDKIKWDGYIDQRMQSLSFRFQINAIYRREEDLVKDEDMFTAVKWATEIKSIISSLHDDVVAGKTICDGFIQMDGFPEAFIKYELFPKTTTVIFVAEAEIQLIDTYTNN